MLPVLSNALQTYGSPEGRPVLFLHGFMGRGADWEEVASGLGEGFRCLCPDLPGHGGQALEEEPSIETTADALAGLLAEHGIARAALVGYSMGGRIALMAALRYPELFRPLVLESASPGIRSEDDREARAKRDRGLSRRLEAMRGDAERFRDFLDEWYDAPLFASLQKDPARLAVLIERRIENRPESLGAALRGFSVGRQPALWDAIADYPAPILAMAGEEDRKYRRIAEEMAALSPHVATHVMNGRGHNVHFENPRGYTTVLRAFIESTH